MGEPVTVGELRDIANRILEQIEDEADDRLIRTRCNTCGMYGTILEVSTGFVDCDELTFEDEEDDEDEEDE